MSQDNSGFITLVVLVGLAAYGLHSCNKNPEDTEEYKQGYQSGYEDGQREGYDKGKTEGMDEGKEDLCYDINNFSDSIHDALVNENLCN